MLLLVLLLTGSAYLVRSVPPHHWEEVSLPNTHWDSPVMPVRKFAVHRTKPEKLLYELHDAYHVSQVPDRPISVVLIESDLNPAKFREQFRKHMTGLSDLDEAGQPVARLLFEMTTDGDKPARGEMRIYGYLDESGQPWFHRSLLYTTAARDGQEQTLLLPPSPASVAADPLAWAPWPTTVLIEANLIPMSGTIDATLENHLDGSSTSVKYEILDLLESFVEFDDGMLFERAVASNDPDVEIDFEGEQVRLLDVEREVAWDEVESWVDWVAYTPPTRNRFDDVHPRRADPGAGPIDLIAKLTAEVGGREAIGRLLANLDIDWQAFETRHGVSSVAREAGELVLEVITVTSSTFDEIAHKLSSLKAVHLLHHEAGGLLRKIRFPSESPDARVIDVFPLDDTGLNVLLRIQPGGLIHTTNGGETWQDFNLDQGAIENAREIEVVVTGHDRGVIYVLAYDYDEDTGAGGSQLFRLKRQDWVARWKAGLIALLEG